jgi:hypothetical protein
MNEPKRRERRLAHLDASVVPVERAFLARAEAMKDERDGTAPTDHDMFLVQAEIQFRMLAEELHWW